VLSKSEQNLIAETHIEESVGLQIKLSHKTKKNHKKKTLIIKEKNITSIRFSFS
jgi:hypothetical protein